MLVSFLREFIDYCGKTVERLCLCYKFAGKIGYQYRHAATLYQSHKKRRLTCYGHISRMSEDRLLEIIYSEK